MHDRTESCEFANYIPAALHSSGLGMMELYCSLFSHNDETGAVYFLAFMTPQQGWWKKMGTGTNHEEYP